MPSAKHAKRKVASSSDDQQRKKSSTGSSSSERATRVVAGKTNAPASRNSNDNNRRSSQTTTNKATAKRSDAHGLRPVETGTPGTGTSDRTRFSTGTVQRTSTGTSIKHGRSGGSTTISPSSIQRVGDNNNVPNTIVSNGNQVEDTQSIRSTLTNSQALSIYDHGEELAKKKEEKSRKIALQEYIRHDLFPRWKFFTNKKQMVFSDKKGGIVTKICNDLFVRKEQRHIWWDNHSKEISEGLNRKRNDVITSIKRLFLGKL